MKHIVYDIGAVLVDWQPHLAWADELGEQEARAFLSRVGFDKLNFACDAGATFAEAAKGIPCAEDRARLEQYVERYALTVPAKIAESWDILYRLKDAGRPVSAITNWSAETWPHGCAAHPELTTVFDWVVVSGQVGMVKPSAAIFRHFCEMADTAPADCIFIDDGLHNCLGARAAGMDAIHFIGAEHLETELQSRGLL